MTLIIGKNFRVPLLALESQSLRKPERLAAFTRLCGQAANVGGVYHYEGHAVRHAPGQVVMTHEMFAQLCGTSRHIARRDLEAFEHDRLISIRLLDPGDIVDQGDRKTPKASLITVLNMKEDDRAKQTPQ